ncbi:MAG TPA: hypothetical protein VNX68_16230 [Nitrosopumilaceae archaeon]|jgi:hypothetical protein|nr:hypothetical protein [Nitrosopumilaceae archaeon]
MSLVATYVRATDGKFYKDPILSGRGWFICFDDDDPVELVISCRSKKKPEGILEKIGMEHTPLRYRGIAGRMFGKAIKFTDAESWFFEIENRVNPKFITEHDGIAKKNEIHQGVFYDPIK